MRRAKKTRHLFRDSRKGALRKFGEYILAFAAAEALLVFLNFLCYQDLWWLLPEQILLLPCFKIWNQKKVLRQKKLCEKGFRALLQSLVTSLQAGYSLENACHVALGELEALYQGRNHPMMKPMRRIARGIALHIPLEQLFQELAENTDLEDARQFAVMIEIVRSTGGNMVDILKRSMEHMKIKMDAAEEIEVLLSGKLFEKNIMLLMPFFILFYLRVTSPEYVECFYTSTVGHLLMSAVIGGALFCFYWSEKIMNIDF